MVATTLTHHAVAAGDPSRAACGLKLEQENATVREAHAEMVTCLACIKHLPVRTEEQLVALGMEVVMRLQREHAPPKQERDTEPVGLWSDER